MINLETLNVPVTNTINPTTFVNNQPNTKKIKIDNTVPPQPTVNFLIPNLGNFPTLQTTPSHQPLPTHQTLPTQTVPTLPTASTHQVPDLSYHQNLPQYIPNQGVVNNTSAPNEVVEVKQEMPAKMPINDIVWSGTLSLKNNKGNIWVYNAKASVP